MMLILIKEFHESGDIYYLESNNGIIIHKYSAKEVQKMIKNNVNILIL